MPFMECLTGDELNLFLAGRLPSERRDGVELHLSRCRVCCCRLVSLFENSKIERVSARTPLQLKASARALPNKRRASLPFLVLSLRRRAAAAPALAVLVMLGLTSLLLLGLPERARRLSTTDDALLRQPPHSSPAPQLLAPGAGAVIASDPIEFRWSDVPGASRYTITLLNERGDIAFRTSSAATRLGLPRSSLHSTRGRPYFWYVEVLLSEGTAVDSEMRKFILK